MGEPTYVLVGPDDPEGMVRHTEECRQRGYAFVADPRQQLAFGEGELIRALVDGAAYLFSNEYESHLIESKTGWSADEILDRVGTQVITLGKDGVRVVGKGQETDRGRRRARRQGRRADRRRRRLPLRLPRRAGVGARRTSAPAQVGCVLAAYVVEQVGTQEYSFTHAEFVARLGDGLRRGGRRRGARAPRLSAQSTLRTR